MLPEVGVACNGSAQPSALPAPCIMEACADAWWQLALLCILALIGALQVLRVAARWLCAAILALARLASGQPPWEYGERSAPYHVLINPTAYFTRYGDKWHVDYYCPRLANLNNIPYSREFCELCAWKYIIQCQKKPKLL